MRVNDAWEGSQGDVRPRRFVSLPARARRRVLLLAGCSLSFFFFFFLRMLLVVLFFDSAAACNSSWARARQVAIFPSLFFSFFFLPPTINLAVRGRAK